jgi:hypothetical protein
MRLTRLKDKPQPGIVASWPTRFLYIRIGQPNRRWVLPNCAANCGNHGASCANLSTIEISPVLI